MLSLVHGLGGGGRRGGARAEPLISDVRSLSTGMPELAAQACGIDRRPLA